VVIIISTGVVCPYDRTSSPDNNDKSSPVCFAPWHFPFIPPSSYYASVAGVLREYLSVCR